MRPSKSDIIAKELVSKIEDQRKSGRLEDNLTINSVEFLNKNKHLGKKKRGYNDTIAILLAFCYAKNLMGEEGAEGRSKYEEHYFNCSKCFQQTIETDELISDLKNVPKEAYLNK